MAGNIQWNTTSITPNSSTPFFHTCQDGINASVENVSVAVIMALLMLASVVGNSLVIASICLSKELRRRVTVYFIASLAISDMFIAVVLIPVRISEKLHMWNLPLFCHDLATCYWVMLGDVLGNTASILNLFFIAVDRYIAIRYPFKHASMFSAYRVKRIIAGIWLFSIVWTPTSVFIWDKEQSRGTDSILSIVTFNNVCGNKNPLFFVVSFIGIYGVALVLITFMYFMILKIALSQIKAIASTQIQPRAYEQYEVDQTNTVDGSKSPAKKAKKQKENLRRKRELNATKSVAIVYFAFVILWVPSAIVSMISVFKQEIFPMLLQTNKAAFFFISLGLNQIFVMLNTMLNPIIYSFSNGSFRRAFHMVYFKISGKEDSRAKSNSFYVTSMNEYH